MATEIKRLKINLELLGGALADYDPNHLHFLHLASGKIVSALEGFIESDADAEILDRIEEDSESYEQVPRATFGVDYGDMTAFVKSVRSKAQADALLEALRGEDPHGDFVAALKGSPAVAKRWVTFRATRRRDRALEWLNKIGVEPV